jgi:serine/threonine protein phosphatase PrpC
MLSDAIYSIGNEGHSATYGATLSGVWLTGRHAIFVNLGDSRGYLLPKYKKKIRQITTDHNVAALMVQHGEITKEEARCHPSSATLTRFAGMNAPATPDVFIREIQPGDKILLCSDGLHGMIDDAFFPSILRSSRNPDRVCKRLIDKANANGGRDNISVVYIKITV